jgi:hypothetical protein
MTTLRHRAQVEQAGQCRAFPIATATLLSQGSTMNSVAARVRFAFPRSADLLHYPS